VEPLPNSTYLELNVYRHHGLGKQFGLSLDIFSHQSPNKKLGIQACKLGKMRTHPTINTSYSFW
jgi:hypothetical protein